jgi:hypothetical protein
VPSATAKLSNLELSEVEVAVGSRSFERGRAYARRGRVLEVAREPDGATLVGSVAGNGALYTTTAFFVEGNEGTLAFEDGGCSWTYCPRMVQRASAFTDCCRANAAPIPEVQVPPVIGDIPSRRAYRRRATRPGRPTTSAAG